jgi:hypothetical protein
MVQWLGWNGISSKGVSKGVKSAFDSWQTKNQSLTFTAAFSSADLGKPKVRFDVGELEVEPSATAPDLYSTVMRTFS